MVWRKPKLERGAWLVREWNGCTHVVEVVEGGSGSDSNSRQHLHMTTKFVIGFNILTSEKSADILAFALDFPARQSVTVRK